MNIFQELSNAIQAGRKEDLIDLLHTGLKKNIPPIDLLNKGLIVGMDEIGKAWKRNEVYIPEVLIAARAMSAGSDLLEPQLINNKERHLGTVVVGTVKGDLHDIGKNLVAMMLKGKGFKVIDLGTDVDAEKFYQAAKEHQADYLCMSTLLTTTMSYFKIVIDYFETKEPLDIQFLCGGAPVTEKFTKEVGADYYAEDAVSAADLLLSLAMNE